MLDWLTRRPARPRASAPEAQAPPQAKASATRPLIALGHAGRAVWSAGDYAGLARTGFMRNPVVYRSVRMIAEAAASLPMLLYDGARELDRHPLLALLRRPNATQAGADFLEALYGHLLVAGNAYVERVAIEGEVRELHALRPDRVRVVTDAAGWPAAYEYTANGRTLSFAQEGIPPPVLHVALFHPLDDHYGMAPLSAAHRSLDLHNAAAEWAKALLDNAARPSGALVYEGEGEALSEEQFERLRQELEANFSGVANAGRPLLLEGGLRWQAMSLSPRDMDFLDARHAAARDIALAFGVPPMLLGIPGDNTYSNYAQANLAFWRQTVLPLANRVAGAFAAWLGPAYGGELRLAYDLDQVEALAAEREALWRRVGRATFLSEEEKRAAVGYGTRARGEAGEGG